MLEICCTGPEPFICDEVGGDMRLWDNAVRSRGRPSPAESIQESGIPSVAVAVVFLFSGSFAPVR